MKTFKNDDLNLEEQLTLVISKKLAGAEKCQAGFATIGPGKSLPADGYSQHPTEEISYILSGKIKVETDTESDIVTEGDLVFMESGRPHKNTNIGDDTAKVLWFVAPPTVDE